MGCTLPYAFPVGLTGIRPPKCGKTLHIYGQVWSTQYKFVTLRNKLRRIAGQFAMLYRTGVRAMPQSPQPKSYLPQPPSSTLSLASLAEFAEGCFVADEFGGDAADVDFQAALF